MNAYRLGSQGAMEKLGYSTKDLLGDALAAGTAGLATSQYGLGSRHRAEERRIRRAAQAVEHAYYYGGQDRPSQADATDYINQANWAMINHQQKAHDRDELGNVAGLGHTVAGLVAPVGDHHVASAILPALLAGGSTALLSGLAPNAGALAHGAAGAGGALLGRLGIRGYDALTKKEE